jgi:hypothetical protein
MNLTILALFLAAQNDKPPEEKPKKDPLAYRIHEFEGGSVAKFDDWVVAAVPSGSNSMVVFDTAPKGREKDFAVRIVVATPEAGVMEKLFEVGPQLVQQYLPGFERDGEPQKTKFGGDEAMIETYKGDNLEGRKTIVRCVYIKKKDIAVAVFGIGSEGGHKDFGRAVEIVSQSITFKEGVIEKELTGSWHTGTYNSSGSGDTRSSVSTNRSITIYPNGTFTEIFMTSTDVPSGGAITEGNRRGRIVKRGKNLTFHFDDGSVINAAYELKGGALMLNGTAYFRQ